MGATLGYLRPLWSIAGRAEQQALHIMLRCFLGCTPIKSSMDANFCPAAKLGSQTGRSSDLDIFYCGIQALRSRSKGPRSQMEKARSSPPGGSLGQVRMSNDDKAIVRRRYYNLATRLPYSSPVHCRVHGK